MSDGTTIARPYAEALFQISIDEDEMRKIASNLGEKGNHTDLLFINEQKE